MHHRPGATTTIRHRRRESCGDEKKSSQDTYVNTIAKPAKTRDFAVMYGTSPSYLDTVTAHQGDLPGPGQYYVDDTASRMAGGKFSTAYPKSEVDEKMFKALREPGPGEYETVITNRAMPLQCLRGGGMSNSKRITELDTLQARARKTPGPGANGAVDGPRPHFGCKFQLANVPTELDIIEKNSKKSPAPHDYGYPDELQRANRTGGQFSSAFPPTALEAAIKSKEGVPGPASYAPKAPGGTYVGKCSMERLPSDQDRQIAAARRLPGPGEYNLESTLIDRNPGSSKWPSVGHRPNPRKPKEGFVVPEPYVRHVANRKIGLKGLPKRTPKPNAAVPSQLVPYAPSKQLSPVGKHAGAPSPLAGDSYSSGGFD
mmetsp:Transcript_29542/g.60396  ORF Transcript_29542/g.60396 Transcript_29542/m.60396 type:complete len:372 (-) Transcript_29542:221-1336(-)